MSKAVEFIQFEVSEAKAATFIAARHKADAFLQANTTGHLGTELYDLGQNTWLMLVHWASEADMRAAQQITESAAEITAFVATADRFLRFDSGVQRYRSLR